MRLAIYPLASVEGIRHNGFAAKTNAAWFGDQNNSRRTTATRRYFYVHTLLRAFFGRAIAGIPSGMPVSLGTGSPTLLSARPPHLAMRGGVINPKEAAMRVNALARPEQTQSPTELTPFQAGIQSARAWFACPQLSAATHRDNARCAFVRTIADDSEAAIASFSFNRGFAHGLAKAMAEVSHE